MLASKIFTVLILMLWSISTSERLCTYLASDNGLAISPDPSTHKTDLFNFYNFQN